MFMNESGRVANSKLILLPSLSVIPAKAGIQVVVHSRVWIPAFAGMTPHYRFLALA